MADMEAFWDARARENAAFYVDNRLDYDAPDLDAFWAAGEEGADFVLRGLGLSVGPDDDLVEIGAGIGRITRVLAARARSVRALDVSAEMLARAPEIHGVEWVHGDGRTLTGIADASADGVFSHVVFQHLPDPALTYGYVAEMGRVLRPGGWAAFQVSDDPAVHRRRLRGGKAARHPAWLGSAVDLATLRATADAAGLDVERTVNEGTQYCLVALRRR